MTEQRDVIITLSIDWFRDGHKSTGLTLTSYDEGVAEALRFALDQVLSRDDLYRIEGRVEGQVSE